MSYQNALLHETSPYLLQHAHQPVQWYPWGEIALNLAKEQNKPILLSIGYSACHWCHVMAHESFEEVEVAQVMNELFINIKVDREERPDLDKIYQIAHQLITSRHGGWPLTMFLNPQTQYPFFGGTYFPPEERYGLPAFKALLQKVSDYYHSHERHIAAHQRALTQALQQLAMTETVSTEQINVNVLNQVRAQLAEQFDNQQGGFGGAPKFPQFAAIERLLRHYNITKKQGQVDQEALEMALLSLSKMAQGGIYDHLGGGLCRYSVDELWMIPHFEKMLYDNGQFLTLYSQAYQLTKNDLFQQVVQETADWALREMQSPEGGFYSSLDADSEGKEGEFYVWDKAIVKNLLDSTIYPLFAYQFGLVLPANFEDRWHLHQFHDDHAMAQHFNLPIETVQQHIATAKTILLQQRNQRIRPQRDDKLLTSWNGLMIKGLATAGWLLQRPDYVNSAERAIDFIQQTLWQQGRLYATYKDGKAHLSAYLDDYAFLLDALLTLLQVRWRSSDLQFAIELAEVTLEEFWDKEQGGFYFTAHSHEPLISRLKSFSDDALPNSNGVLALSLGRLGHLLGEMRYIQAAEKTLQVAWQSIQQMPHVHNTILSAVEEYLLPPQVVVLRGETEQLLKWQAVCRQHFAPNQLCVTIPNDVELLPGLLGERKPQGDIVAYLCTGVECRAPMTDFEEFKTVITCQV